MGNWRLMFLLSFFQFTLVILSFFWFFFVRRKQYSLLLREEVSLLVNRMSGRKKLLLFANFCSFWMSGQPLISSAAPSVIIIIQNFRSILIHLHVHAWSLMLKCCWSIRYMYSENNKTVSQVKTWQALVNVKPYSSDLTFLILHNNVCWIVFSSCWNTRSCCCWWT